MLKVIKIADGFAFVGKDYSGETTAVPLSSFSFTPRVGDSIELHQNGNTYMVTKSSMASQFNSGLEPKVEKQKSKLAATLLCIFGGFWGFYEFYIGRITMGIVRICFTLLSCFPVLTLPLGFFNLIWCFSNAYAVFTSKPGSKWHQDAYGRELLD